MSIEININCDLGEKSKHHSNKHDPDLLEIVNSANIACGYHAGDEETMNQVVEISKKNGVSIGAHPSFNDPENFGRERMNLSSSELEKLINSKKDLLDRIPINKIGKPEDIAYAAVFLASDEASYITGQTITVDGGRVIN